MATEPRVIEGGRFDAPLVIPGRIAAEPERYIAEKPYELTKYEFSVLRRKTTSDFWFTAVVGATAGILIAVAGKALAALLEKKSPTLESWEIWAVIAGAALSIILKCFRTSDDKERAQLETVVAGHFTENRPRRLHLTGNVEKE